VKNLVFVLALAAGCGSRYQSVRMDIPVGARVHIDPGYSTPAVDFTTPFVGQFEIGSLAVGGGIPMRFSLDAATAQRYGADHPVEIYARLSVGKPTEFARTQTLRIVPKEDRVRALIRGEISEYSTYVEDPSVQRRLCELTMRMSPF